MYSTATKIGWFLALAVGLAVPQMTSAGQAGGVARSLTPASACAGEATGIQDGLSVPSSGIPLGFAMADFTGDGNPDLATVELNRLNSSVGRYLIEIRLTEGGRQSLRLKTYAGELLVTPQDVTGDGNLDLVVHTAQSAVPLAVFLNDGTGHFSEAAAPNEFMHIRDDAASDSRITAERPHVSGAIIASGSYAARCRAHWLRYPQRRDRLLFSNRDAAPRHSFLAFGSNRAPPAVA